MSSERTDEFLKWRGLLDQAEFRADPVLDDKEASWQKLADRLGERRSNRLSGYRIAAACLLFALIPAARLFQDHYNSIGVRRHSQSGYTPTTAVPAHEDRVPATPQNKSLSTPPPPTLPTSEDRRLAASRTRPQHLQKSPARKTDRAYVPELAGIPSSPSCITAAPLDPEGPATDWKSLKTKELKVVHQNEIRGAGSPSPSVGATSTGRLLNILVRPSRQEQPSLPPSPSASEDPALLKIKLAPSN